MQATVTLVVDGIVTVRVRRSYQIDHLQGRHYDLKHGDRITVERRTNNPYLVRVQSDSD